MVLQYHYIYILDILDEQPDTLVPFQREDWFPVFHPGWNKFKDGEYEPPEIPPGVCTTLREMNIRFNKSKNMDPTFLKAPI